jgi:hypothetical protein
MNMNKVLQKHIDKNGIKTTDDGKYLYAVGSVMGDVDMIAMPKRVSDIVDAYSLILFIRADECPCLYTVLMHNHTTRTVREILHRMGESAKYKPDVNSPSHNPYHIYPTNNKVAMPDEDKNTPLEAEDIIRISNKEWSGGHNLNKRVCLPMLEAMIKVSPWKAYYHHSKERNR